MALRHLDYNTLRKVRTIAPGQRRPVPARGRRFAQTPSMIREIAMAGWKFYVFESIVLSWQS